jgi:hypothetical protein
VKPVRFLEESQGEFPEQISHDEARHKGLGDLFRDAVEGAIALASVHAGVGVT